MLKRFVTQQQRHNTDLSKIGITTKVMERAKPVIKHCMYRSRMHNEVYRCVDSTGNQLRSPHLKPAVDYLTSTQSFG
jgi:hypothetical protein